MADPILQPNIPQDSFPSIATPVVSQHELSMLCGLRSMVKNGHGLIALGDFSCADTLPKLEQALQEMEEETAMLLIAGAGVEPGPHTAEFVADDESSTETRLQITLHRSSTVVY